MRFLFVTLFKGAASALCFIAVLTLIFHFTKTPTEFRWSVGDRDKNIISVAGDGSGNTDIGIADKNIRIRQSDMDSLTDRLSELLK